MRLKFAVIVMILLSSTIVAAEPATKADVQAVETKVNEIDKRLIRLETKVDEMDARLTTRIEELDKRLTNRIEELDKRLTTRIEEMDKRLTARIDMLFWAIGALIGIVLAVIALPQLLGYFQEKRAREDFRQQIRDLTQRLEEQQQEIEELKSRRIVTRP